MPKKRKAPALRAPSWAERVDALVAKLGSVEMVAAKLGVSWITVKRWREKTYKPSRLGQRQIEELERSK